MDDLISIIMRNNRHSFLSAIRSLEIVMRNRPDWFECFSLGRDLRNWFGNHFRHLLCRDRRFFLRNRTYWFECSFLRGDLWDRLGNHFRHLVLNDWRDRFGDHFRHLLGGDHWFLLRNYLRWRLPR